MTDQTAEDLARQDLARQHWKRGMVLAEQEGKPDAGMEEYRQALALDPDFANLHVSIGKVHNLRNQRELAIACMQKAISLDRDNMYAHQILAGYLLEARDYEGARRELLEQKRIKVHIDTHYLLGFAYRKLRQYDLALEEFWQETQFVPDAPKSYVCLGNMLALQGHTEQAIEKYRQAYRLDSTTPEVKRGIVVALLLQGRFLRAIKELFR